MLTKQNNNITKCENGNDVELKIEPQTVEQNWIEWTTNQPAARIHSKPCKIDNEQRFTRVNGVFAMNEN